MKLKYRANYRKKFIKLAHSAVIFSLIFPYPVFAETEYKYFHTPYQSNYSLRTDAVTGAFNFSLPLSLSPGRKGLQPELQISYNSLESDNSNLMGYGWNLSIPSIERINKKGVDKLYALDFYYSSLTGELEKISSTSYGSKVDNGEFLQYEFLNNSWTVTDKRGTSYKFGTTAQARQDNPNDTTKVYKWMLEEMRDTNNNYIRYEYFKDYGQIYPSKIIYTGNNTTDGIFEIEFFREARPDNATTTDTGFYVKTNYKVQEIQSKVRGDWVRKYNFGYTSTTDRSVRSLLESVKEFGKDEQGIILNFASSTLDYQTRERDNGEDWLQDSNYANSIVDDFITSAFNDNGIRLADVNGDGLADIIRSKQQLSQRVYLNKGDGSGWDDGNTFTGSIPEWFINSSVGDTGIRFGDANGDGLIDLIQSYKDGGGEKKRVYLNKGGLLGWEEDLNYRDNIPSLFVDWSVGWNDVGARLAEINGDGLVDIIKLLDPNNGTRIIKEIYINKGDGTGWQFDSNYGTSTLPFILQDGKDRGTRLVDVNGDGMTDILQSLKNDSTIIKKLFLNKGDGTGWDEAKYLDKENLPIFIWIDIGGNVHDYQIHFGDVNGDGLIDIIESNDELNTQKVFTNKGDGTGWVYDNAYTLPGYFADNNSKDKGWREADVNGDGLVDFVHSQASTRHVSIAQGKQPDLLSKIKHSKGAITKIIYKHTPQYLDSNNQLLNPKLPLVIPTTFQIVRDNGLELESTTTNKYFDAFYHYNDPYDKKFAGFNKIEETNDFGFVTRTSYYQGNGSNTSTGEYIDNISKLGKPFRTEKYDNNNNLFSKTITPWEHVDLGNNRNFVKATRTVEFMYDGNSTHKDRAFSYVYNDTNGNLAQKIEWGEVTGSDDASFTDIGADKFITDISYASSSTNPIFSVPSQETVTDQGAIKAKETKFNYDNLALGSVSRGNETRREFWKTGATSIDTEKSYNSYGLVTQEKDPRDKITTYSYDRENLYATTSTNPLNHVTTFAYDYSSGKVASTTDQNGRTSITTYDGFDRVKEAKQPDLNNPSNLVTKTLYTYTDAQPVSTVQKTEYLDSTISFDTYTYKDGLERIIQVRKEAEDANIFSAKDFHYNRLGLLKKESLPYFSTGSARTASTSDATLYTLYTYDALSRVATTTNVLGSTINSYDDWKVTVTDAEGNTKELLNDAHGRLVTVKERNDGETYTAGSYAYNYLGNLTSLTDANGNTRSFTYDGLGRRLLALDLHASGDSSYGAWSYFYDDAGNLLSFIDPKNQTVSYSYDDINRVLTEDFTGQAGTEVTYFYDQCADGNGRLCRATSTGAVTKYNYNPLGLTKDEFRTMDSVEYLTKFSYDRQGNTTLLTYPDNSEAKYEYNTAGLLEKLSQREGGGAFTELISDFDYSPLEQVTFEKFYNGLETKYIFDSAELYRLKKLKTATSTAGFGIAVFSSPSPLPNLFPELVEGTTFSIALLPDSTPPTDGQTEGQTAEIPDKRTKNSKTYQIGTTENGGPVYKTEFYANDIHYFNSKTQQYEDIDMALQVDTGGWSMRNAPYSVKVKNVLGDDFVEFENQGQKLFFSLLQTPALPVLAQKPLTENFIEYKNALGAGIDIAIMPEAEKLQKQIIIQSKEALGDISQKQYYEIPFKLTSNRNIDLDIDGKLLSNLGSIQSSKMVAIRDNLGGLSYILPPYAQDANGNRIPIEILYEKKPDGIYLTKKLPTDWLNTAVYPVVTDATISYSSGTGDGWVSNNDPLWSSARSASVGTFNNATSTAIEVFTGKTAGGNYDIARSFLPFDTSAIPDNADILSSKLKVYVTSKSNSDDDGDDWISVIQTSQASTSGLTNEDFDQATTTTEGIDVSERKDITNIATGQYLVFALNATSTPWISKTSYTKLGLREGHDIRDSAYAGSNNTYNKIAFKSRETGTLNAPKLEVTYTANPLFMQEIFYTYDKVGNIKKIDDTSWHNGAKTTEFRYDNLYRLVTATTTNAKNGDNYTQIYSYNKLGNILNKSDIGAYLYQGDQGTNYANPHAVTSVNGKTYSYDNNGNLLNNQERVFTWDYMNRLVQTASSTATSTYKYNHTTQRARLDDGTSTTHYANKYYNVSYLSPFPNPSPSASPTPTPINITKHLYANSKNIATVEGYTSKKTFINHNDHLGGSNTLSDQYGRLEQLLDYYPFGSIRIDQRGENNFNEQRKHTGHEYDEQTKLNYLGARYYPSDAGRFLSEDPAFLAVGNESELQSKTQLTSVEYLSNPQFFNSYSYTVNNPLKFQDKNGEFIETLWDAANVAYDVGNVVYKGGVFLGSIFSLDLEKTGRAGEQLIQSSAQLGLDIGATAIPFVPAGFTKFDDATKFLNKVDNLPAFKDIKKLETHFQKHGSDFSAKNVEDYANKAKEFLSNSQKNNFSTKIDSEGVIRIYDQKTNTFGAYNPDGSVKTFFKPSSPSYFERQPGEAPTLINNFKE